MSTAVNVSVVHEPGARRQFTRIKLSARIHYIGANHGGVDTRLLDLSAGDFVFTTSGASIQPDDLYKGKLLFQVDSIGFSPEVKFQVRSVGPVNHRVGCEFQNLEPREVAALHYLVTPYLTSEVIGIDDVLNTLQRENFTKARKQGGGNGGMGFFSQIRVVTLGTAIFVVRVGTFAFILNQMYNLYFITHADSSMVGIPSQQITMPREGTIQSLLGPSTEAAKSAPVATFSANLLDMLKGNLTEEQLNPDNVEGLFNHQMKGTLTSPYGCHVVQQLVADEQYANKGQAIFTLAPCDSVASIEARFPYRNAVELTPGTRVNFQVTDNSVNRSGRIVSTAPVGDDLSSEIRVQIQPNQPLDAQYADRPAGVSIGDLPGRTLLNKAVTLATAR